MNRIKIGLAACALALAAAPVLAGGPGVLKFDETSFEVSEAAGVAVVVVERSNGEDGSVSVHYATSDGTATAGQDYTAVSGTLSWGSGDEANKTFLIPLQNDGVAEGAETIRLTLSSATGGAAIDPARGTSTVVILANNGGGGGGGGGDDNGGRAGVLKWDESDFEAFEGATAIVTVERSHGESGAVSVQYRTENGTATAGQDYTAVSGTLSWGSGDESSKVVEIPLRDDNVNDGGETVRLILSNPTGGATLDSERGTSVLRILEPGDDDNGDDDDDNGDDDSRPGTIKFDERSYQVIEGTATARIAVERSHGERGAVTVQFSTADGSATAGEDYTPASGTLSWGPGDGARKFFTIPILADSAQEGNETVRLTLSNPTGGATLDPDRKTAVLQILDRNGSTAACVGDDRTLCLKGGRFKVEVEWRTPQGLTGKGHKIPVSDDSGLVWFFDDSNVEMLVKVLDACNPYETFWVFFAATTNVDFTATVTDTRSGIVKQYKNPAGRIAEPVQDTATFRTCNQ